MYWTGKDPFTGSPCFVEKDVRARERQKEVLTGEAARGGTKRRGRAGSRKHARKRKK
jgi:hypothetical protein